MLLLFQTQQFYIFKSSIWWNMLHIVQINADSFSSLFQKVIVEIYYKMLCYRNMFYVYVSSKKLFLNLQKLFPFCFTRLF